MFVLFSVSLFIGATFASKSVVGVDPNALSCDAEGKEYLLLPHHTDCSKFYKCTHGEEVEFECVGGLIFDFAQQACNWPSNTECTLRGEDDIEGSGSGDGDDWSPLREGHIYPEDDASLSTLNGLSSRLLPSEPVFVVDSVLDCRSAGAAAKQAPYVGDCQRYWRCINGVPQTAFCSDGLFFNEATQQCDFEANVRCVDQGDDELKGEFIVY